MAQPSPEVASKKRKLHREENDPPNKHCPTSSRPATLIGPHEAIIAELSSKYNLLPASVISSSKIRQRTTSATEHLLSIEGTNKPRVILLHARTDCLSKLITIVETTKRVLGQEGKAWWQYNQLFEQSERAEKKKKDVVEETMLEKGNVDAEEEEEEDSYFETMGTRLEEAIHPAPKAKVVKSLRVFLAIAPIPELRMKGDVTLQTSSDGP